MSELSSGGEVRRRGPARSQPVGRIRLLIVDDHDLFRVGLASVLAAHDDLEVVAQASRGTMAIRLAAELRPDVILMDQRLPDVSGPAVTQAILAHDLSVRIVALTVTADESDIAAAIEAGACGYVLKESTVDDIVAAIRAAASGTAWLSPQAARALLDRVRRQEPQADPIVAPNEELSPRELEVLRLVARGMDNNEIAAELSISPRTAKNHVASILGKLRLDNRIQAAVYAVRRGIA